MSVTISAEKAKAQAAEADKKAAEEKAKAEEKASRPPLNAEQQLATRVELSQLDQQRLQRLREEIEGLRRSLSQERRDLDERQAALDADKAAFAEQVRQFTASSGDEQFTKTLGVLSALKPKEAKAMIEEMIAAPIAAGAIPAPDAQGAGAAAQPVPADRFTKAARYLNAMDERARNRIMSEFAKGDPKLAVELLDAVRRQGEFASANSR
jgi:membrane-associated HD superfamily phosphohydrolase